MRLKHVTLWVIISLCYFFLLRTFGTIAHAMFRNVVVAQISVVLSIIGSAAILIFFTVFYADYIQHGQAKLKQAAIIAIIGSAMMVLLQLKGLFLVFKGLSTVAYSISPSLLKLIQSSSVEPAIPLISAIFILFFFAVFYGEIPPGNQSKLKKAIRFAIIGSAIGLMIQVVTLFNFILSTDIRWLSELPLTTALILLPVVTIGFLLNLYFYVIFYSEQGS